MANITGKTAHGQAGKTSEYNTWCAMKSRCNNPNNQDYKIYGGKGIRVCERWNKFENFIFDMGIKPSAKHTLDRYPNKNGNYEPSNCRWATAKEQARNTSINVNITFHGETLCVSEWAERLGVDNSVLQQRLKTWPLKDALTKPLVKTRKRNTIGAFIKEF